jgi:hypothetical protein
MPKNTQEYTLTLTRPEITRITKALLDNRKAAEKRTLGRWNAAHTAVCIFREACWLAEPANEAALKAQQNL